MKLENNKNQTKRRSSPKPKKSRAKEEGNPMAQSILETRDSGKLEKNARFPRGVDFYCGLLHLEK